MQTTPVLPVGDMARTITMSGRRLLGRCEQDFQIPRPLVLANALRLNRSIHYARSEVNEPEHKTEEQHGTDSCRVDEFEYNFNLETVENRPTEEYTDDTDEKAKPSTEATETEPSTNDTAAPASGTDTPASQDSDAHPPAPSETKTVRKKFRSDDPIYWYGILVPPSLRTAQKSFTEAIQTQVPDLAGTIVEMRALEQKITHVRTKLGIDTSEQDSAEE